MAAPSGIVWGSTVGSYGRIGIYAGVSSTATKVTASVEIWIWTKYSVSDTSNTLYYNNSSSSSGSATDSVGSVSISTTVDTGSGWSTSNQKKLKSYSYTYNRGTSTSTRYLYAKLVNVDRVGEIMYANTEFTVPKLSSYTVSYNANGGSGAPDSQTKWYGTALTLSSNMPTRTGYSFQGWATSSTGSVAYAAGASYTSNSSVTLYAVWKANTYTVTYNANGGSGAPSKQTKTYGVALTLSSTKPTKTGHEFQGWATSASGSVAYAAGAKYTSNSEVTLYAVWKANTYTVSYNANGGKLGSGAPSKQTKTYGVKLELTNIPPTRTNYTFKGWGKSASTTTVSYKAGDYYTANAAITLYAVWELAYTKPRITSFSVARCDSNEVASDTGTYAIVKFNWACDKTVSSVKIERKLASETSWANSSSMALSGVTGTSGTVSQKIGNNGISTDKTYSVRVTVSDASGSSSSTKTLNGASFPIDVLKGGKGIAFGKSAELSGYADVGYKLNLRDNMFLPNGKAINGRNAEDTTNLNMLYVNTSNNTILGYGGYSNQIGTMNIYGNQVRMTSRTGVFVDGIQVAANSVLWSGKHYMNSDQTVSLDAAISKQANGIVLVWSEFSDGAPVDAHFNTFFIPKYFVSVHSSKCVALTLTSAEMNVMASKYVRIYDTSIGGYAANADEATTKSCGIKTTPRNFVLRYVIGV